MNFSHEAHENCSGQLTGNLTLDEKGQEENYKKIPKKSFPDRQTASFSPLQWNPKGQMADTESNYQMHFAY